MTGKKEQSGRKCRNPYEIKTTFKLSPRNVALMKREAKRLGRSRDFVMNMMIGERLQSEVERRQERVRQKAVDLALEQQALRSAEERLIVSKEEDSLATSTPTW